MITGAMSKWKTTVPHLAREPKSLDSQSNRLQYSLTASKIHGLCNVADWQYGGQFQGAGSGCNFSCSVILANLHLVEESTGEIPRHLKLQMDNCAKDNKNATVLGFCGLLVAEGVVETVEVSNNSQSQQSHDSKASVNSSVDRILFFVFRFDASLMKVFDYADQLFDGRAHTRGHRRLVRRSGSQAPEPKCVHYKRHERLVCSSW